MQLLLEASQPILYSGGIGVGKTAIIMHALASMQVSRGTSTVAPYSINFRYFSRQSRLQRGSNRVTVETSNLLHNCVNIFGTIIGDELDG